MERGVIRLTITHNESLVKVLLPVSESELSQFRGFNTEERNVSPEVLFDNSHLVISSFSCHWGVRPEKGRELLNRLG